MPISLSPNMTGSFTSCSPPAPSSERRIPVRILLLGESWHVHLIHQKGFDSFTNSEYTEGGAEFKEALRSRGWQVDHIPAHRISYDMPQTVEGLAEYDCVVISDVGSNTFLLTPSVFKDSL